MNLLLKTNGPLASQRRLLVGLAAAVGVACGCGLAGAQQNGAAKPPAPPAPAQPAEPPAPSALAPLVFAGADALSTYVFRSVEDGRTIELRIVGDRVEHASIDGQEVPPERIVREGRTVVLKGPDGSTIHAHTIPQQTRFEGRRAMSLQDAFRRGGQQSGPAIEAVVALEPLPVMLGVSMIEPDATLRGHLGLEPGTATLVSAVYDELPAAAAGIEPYDVIVSVDGQTPASPDDVRRVLRDKKPGDDLKVGVIHRGQKRDVTLRLEKYDAERFKAVKVRAIAAAESQESMPGIARLYGQHAPDAERFLRGAIVGRARDRDDMTIFLDPATMAEQQARIAELQRRAEEQAARARELAERMASGFAGDAAAGRRAADDFTRLLEERLRKMEEMMQRFFEERGEGGRAAPPAGGSSPTPPPATNRNPDT